MKPAVLLPAVRAITGAGANWPESWQAVLAGRRRFTLPDSILPWLPPSLPVAAIADETWPGGPPPLTQRLSVLATMLAESLAGELRHILAQCPDARVSIVISTSHGESGAITEAVDAEWDGRAVAPDVWLSLLTERCAAAVAVRLDRVVAASCVSAACASGLVALGYARDLVEAGLCDVCLVIGADALSRVAFVGFRQVGATSKAGCRPFHQDRDGTTVAEGGAALLLVTAAVASRLDAGVSAGSEHVRVLGSATNCDARHVVEPTSAGITDAVRAALDEARVRPEEVSAVYWHGTGTRQNDEAEAAAAGDIFGVCPPGTSTKGVFGHAMGASAVLNLLAARETLRCGLLPPTAMLDAPAFPHLNIVAGQPALVPRGPVLVVALGFGGINSAVVLGHCLDTAS